MQTQGQGLEVQTVVPSSLIREGVIILTPEQGYAIMSEAVESAVKTAGSTWAKTYFGTDEVVSYVFADEDELERYIVVLAARGVSEWQAVEVWLEAGDVVSINSLGEGIPPEDAVWPW